MMFFSTLLTTALLAHGTNAAFYYPDVQTYLLEHILVDNWGAYASNFSSAITPCTRYVTYTGDTALKSGRTTAAQWIRVLFHDMVTANVTAGTGGIDASIGFETGRSENSGSAFNDSFTFWRPFVNGAVSMADLVALGTTMSNNLCGGTNLPYRAGRVDATSADPTTGVPAPETDLDTTLLYFERSGFDRTDAIGLTACGHTMGSVHHGGFPDVVDASAVTPNNTNGGSNFDTTRGVFDPLVVSEYVSWTGNKGGPLVTTSNVTTQSDLRLYESDKNATMRSLLAQGSGFLNTCVNLMGRAMNTVPSSVKLGQTINSLPIKPINVTFDFDSNGNLTFSGKIRILSPATTTPPPSLTFHLPSTSTPQTLLPEPSTGTSVFGRSGSTYGTTTYYPFLLTGSLLTSAINSFSISGSNIPAIQSLEIQSQTFVVPSMTTVAGTAVNATIAIQSSHSCGDLVVQVAAPMKQPSTLTPRVVQSSVAVNKVASLGSGYLLCNGILQLSDVPTGLVSVLATSGGKVIDTLLVSAGNAGW